IGICLFGSKDVRHDRSRQALHPWRERWRLCEQASMQLAATPASRATGIWQGLPEAPPILIPRGKFTQKRIVRFQSLPGGHEAILANLAWQWARFDQDSVLLRVGPLRLVLFNQIAPTAHLVVEAAFLPGTTSLEISDGVEFWIPEGSLVHGSHTDASG